MERKKPQETEQSVLEELRSDSEPAATVYGKGCPRPPATDDADVWGESDPAVAIVGECSPRTGKTRDRQ
jgi:hypothetical protein